jgi:hypothetical protein
MGVQHISVEVQPVEGGKAFYLPIAPKKKGS